MQELARLAVAGRLREQASLVGTPARRVPAGRRRRAGCDHPLPRRRSRPSSRRRRAPSSSRTSTSSAGPTPTVAASTASSSATARRRSRSRSTCPADDRRPARQRERPGPARQGQAARGLPRLGLPGRRATRATPSSAARRPPNVDVTPERDADRPRASPHWSLLLVLLLLFAEVVLAWQFGHYTHRRRGRDAPPPAAWCCRSSSACVAGLCFVLVGYRAARRRAHRRLPRLPAARRCATGWKRLARRRPRRRRARRRAGSWAAGPCSSDGGQRRLVPRHPRRRRACAHRLHLPRRRPDREPGLQGPARRPAPLPDLADARRPPAAARAGASTARAGPTSSCSSTRRAAWASRTIIKDEKVRDRAKQLGEIIQKLVKEQLPEKIQADRGRAGRQAPRRREGRRPEARGRGPRTAAQGVRAAGGARAARRAGGRRGCSSCRRLLDQPSSDWLKTLVTQRRMKVHIYQLDAEGRAIKLADKDGAAGEITDAQTRRMIDRAKAAVADLEAEGKDSRLGTAAAPGHRPLPRLVAVGRHHVHRRRHHPRRDHRPGRRVRRPEGACRSTSSASATTTRSATCKLHDLQVEDVVYVNDRVVFEARLTGQGYKRPHRARRPQGQGQGRQGEGAGPRPWSRSIRRARPSASSSATSRRKWAARRSSSRSSRPRSERGEKQPHPGNLRLERTIDVDRRQADPGALRRGAAALRVPLPQVPARAREPRRQEEQVDRAARRSCWTPTPTSPRPTRRPWSPSPRRRQSWASTTSSSWATSTRASSATTTCSNIADFVRGEDSKGKKLGKAAAACCSSPAACYNPHAYKDTPLADVLPIEPRQQARRAGDCARTSCASS